MTNFDPLNSNLELDLEDDDEQNQESGVWLSISDLMSGLLLFFALLFIATQIQLQKYQELIDKLPIAVVEAIEKEIGNEALQVDPKTGDVSLDDQILFTEGSSQLKFEGKQFLNEFIPIYSGVILSNEDFDQLVVRIIIEGHTSSKGSEIANRALSLERALAVTNYIFSDELQFPNKKRFEKKILISGRGEIEANQNIDDPIDRKVTFRFQLRRPDFTGGTDQEEAKIKESIDQESK
ncbi:OmpA/MotB domain protein [Halothece sp. PCC 7418]|uniref:OmpA family protein n=1 Tax=Halothece sp. (strain PCC 7418) TaxID=65093 RepID=UPI0002A08CAA|nr:OmpA family protein [Halothece sp. PCC 7418]AFZ43910.1 OmpA/MotB domain protein [Halothece sp. PCC 7418]